MNKKGTHVDWVISMGIFVVYVFALFLFLRPGIKPVHKPITLLNVLEENFRDDVMWSVKKVPLFIRKCRGGTVDEPASITIDDKNNFWGLGGVKDNKGETKSDNLICNEVDYIQDGISVPFYFYFYKKEEGAPNFQPDCSGIEKDEDCVAEVGVAEDIVGVNEDNLGRLGVEEYDVLHEEWDIPIGKDFAILRDDEYVVKKKPPEKVSVFTRKLTTQTVDRDGDVEPVSIYLQVW